ncbi:MAG: cupredoxin domain-containing protein [Kofleriaceae bacterium]
MLRAAVLSLSLVISIAACKKGEADAKQAPPPIGATPVVVKDGVRHIAITVDTSGYKPEKIAGKPGEKLVLVFTRTADSTCIAQLVTPDKKTVDLPMNTPVEVAVTVPQTGEVGFACGMDMFHGTVVADPSI